MFLVNTLFPFLMFPSHKGKLWVSPCCSLIWKDHGACTVLLHPSSSYRQPLLKRVQGHDCTPIPSVFLPKIKWIILPNSELQLQPNLFSYHPKSS